MQNKGNRLHVVYSTPTKWYTAPTTKCVPSYGKKRKTQPHKNNVAQYRSRKAVALSLIKSRQLLYAIVDLTVLRSSNSDWISRNAEHFV